jgi:hypothetical protein
VWCTCGLAIFSLRRSMQCISISENWHKSPCMVLFVQRLWFRTELMSWNNRNNCATCLTVFQPNVLDRYHSHLKGLQHTYIPICGTFPARRETVQSSNLCCLPSSDANETMSQFWKVMRISYIRSQGQAHGWRPVKEAYTLKKKSPVIIRRPGDTWRW